MANSNGKITGWVDLAADICKVISCSTPTLGAACASDNVNMWSPIKPVEINNQFPDRSGKWWQGTALNCGLKPLKVQTYRDLISAVTGGNSGWTRIVPTTYLRILDFKGYNHNSPCMVAGWTIPDEVKKGDRLLSILNLPNPTVYADFLSLSDVWIEGKVLQDWYFGMMVVSNPNISNNGGEIMSICAGTNGCDTMILGDSKSYTVYPFWSYNEVEYNYSLLEGSLIDPLPMGTNKVITIPNCAPKQVKILPATTAMGVQILITPTKYFDRIHVEVNIFCESATTLQSMVISKRYSTSTATTGELVGEESHTATGLPTTVAAGQKFTYMYDFYDFELTKQYKIWVRLTTNRSTYSASADVI